MWRCASATRRANGSSRAMPSSCSAYDILQLAALLYLTGGLENPFAFLLIAPVTVSASTLPLRVTAALGALTITAATVLTSFHHPLPWFHHSNLLLPFPYVMGVWAAVVSGILFIGFYSLAHGGGGAAHGQGLGRRRDGAGARAEIVGARRAGRGGGARARHAARDHRRGDQGADARRQAVRPALRGPHFAQGAGRALPRHPRPACRRRRAAGHHRVAAVLEPSDRRGGGAAPPGRGADRGEDRPARDGPATSGAGDQAQSRRALWPRQSRRERHRLRQQQGRGRGAVVEGRGDGSSSPTTARAFRRMCSNSSASRSSRPGARNAKDRTSPTSISAWGSASSSPRRCSSGRAPGSSLPTGRCPKGRGGHGGLAEGKVRARRAESRPRPEPVG